MDLKEAMKLRHSVRSYKDKEIEPNIRKELNTLAEKCNHESGLNIQIFYNEPKAFSGMMAHYSKFNNVKNYIALVGKKGKNLEEKCGYYGEQLVLKAQQLGLNTCWVAMTYRKGKTPCIIEKGEKLCCVITLGYGKTQGVSHNSKPIEKLCNANGNMPEWFKKGMKAAQLAPTAMNQQKFLITLNKDDTVTFKALAGFYTKLDLGIVKYHFNIGADKTSTFEK